MAIWDYLREFLDAYEKGHKVRKDTLIRGVCLDSSLDILVNIFVIIGFWHHTQIAKVCTLTC